MATANGTWGGQTGSGSDFFSRVSDIVGTIGNVVGNIGNIVRNPPPIWDQPGGRPVPLPIDDPTYRGDKPTTAGENQLAKYLPFALIGGGLLIAALVLKK